MVIWSGFGWVVPVIAIACFLLGKAIFSLNEIIKGVFLHPF